MTTSWPDDPYFEEAASESVDGGETSEGPLWHAIPPRWGHSMHTMCSYQGMFPARLVHYFVQRFTNVDDLVVDPFSGRGTTALQSRVEGRRSTSSDLNPLAFVLTSAKASPPPWSDLIRYANELRRSYRASDDDLHSAPPEIRMLYSPNTLAQLLHIRRALLAKPMNKWPRIAFMVAGAIAGILHGKQRRDGTSQYLSISMPNTFSMAPTYVSHYIRDFGLVPPEQDVFERLLDKVSRLYLDAVDGPPGYASLSDANRLLISGRVRGRANLVLTSPPYLRVVNYGTANWIRLWWLGLSNVAHNSGAGRKLLDARLDHGHNYEKYKRFMARVFGSIAEALAPGGVAAVVIGDVAVPGREEIRLARQIWNDVGPESGLELIEVIDDQIATHTKVSRIWGETKGRATERDCILVMCRRGEAPARDCTHIRWDEPYRDGGPDEAHGRIAPGNSRPITRTY